MQTTNPRAVVGVAVGTVLVTTAAAATFVAGETGSIIAGAAVFVSVFLAIYLHLTAYTDDSPDTAPAVTVDGSWDDAEPVSETHDE